MVPQCKYVERNIMTKPVIFLGASGGISNYTEVCMDRDILIAGIIDSDYFGNTADVEGIPIIESEKTADFTQLKHEYDFFIGINPIPTFPRNIAKRAHYINLIKQYDLSCVNLIDRECRIARSTILGRGIYIGYGCAIQPHVTIGDHCQIFALTGVGHNTIMEENVTLQRMSSVNSNVTIEKNVYVGASAKLLKFPSMHVGANSFIHPAVTVMRDVGENEIISITGKHSKRIYDTVVF